MGKKLTLDWGYVRSIYVVQRVEHCLGTCSCEPPECHIVSRFWSEVRTYTYVLTYRKTYGEREWYVRYAFSYVWNALITKDSER